MDSHYITKVSEISKNGYGLSEIRIQVKQIISLLTNTYWPAGIIRDEIDDKIANARKEIESKIAVDHKQLASEIEKMMLSNPISSNTGNTSNDNPVTSNDNPVTSVVNPDTLNNEGGAKIRSYKRKITRRRRRR
jgi:hypothetical protein